MSAPTTFSTQFQDIWWGVTRHSELVWEMTRREISERYAGQFLGTLWAVGHPFLLIGIYVFVFGVIYPSRIRIGQDLPSSFVLYILSGLIPWLAFSETMSKATTVILNYGNLVKQVVFPIEILPVKGVLVACITQGVTTALLLVYMLLIEGAVPMTVVLLPILFVFQMLTMCGVSYFFSSLGVYVRDLKDAVQVFLSAGLFLSPILYLPVWVDQIWSPFRYVLIVNPFAHFIWCYQDILFYGAIQHGWSWIVVTVVTPCTLYGGYFVFRTLRVKFSEVL